MLLLQNLWGGISMVKVYDIDIGDDTVEREYTKKFTAMKESVDLQNIKNYSDEFGNVEFFKNAGYSFEDAKRIYVNICKGGIAQAVIDNISFTADNVSVRDASIQDFNDVNGNKLKDWLRL